MIDNQQIRGWYQDSPGRRRYLVIDRESVERCLSGSSGKLFTLSEAAAHLGTSHPRVRLFVEAGLLVPVLDASRPTKQYAHWAFTQEALDNLLGGLSIRLHDTPDCQSLISLNEICRGRTRDGADLVRLLKALQAGELHIMARDPRKHGIQSLLLDRKQFETWFKAWQPEKQVFSLSAAARYLGLKEHVLNWLRQRKFLDEFLQSDENGKPRMTREALEQIKALTPSRLTERSHLEIPGFNMG